MSDEEIDESLSDDEQRRLTALLSSPELWDEPSDDLAQRVAIAVRTEIRAEHEGATVVGFRRRRRVRLSPGTIAGVAIGAAAALLGVVVVGGNDDEGSDASGPTPMGTVSFAGTDLAPGVSGIANIATTESGVQVWFHIAGLPRRDGNAFYQGWMKRCDGTGLVPIGTFHDLTDAIGWAGVAVAEFPVFTVTREVVAAPQAADQATSGEIVVSGAIEPCP